MKHIQESILSVMTILLFLLLALACDDLPIGGDPTCDQLEQYFSGKHKFECRPIDPPIKVDLDYALTLKDRATGEVLSGISYSEFLFLTEVEYSTCPDTCYATFLKGFIKIQEYYFGNVSNENGLITSYYNRAYDSNDEGERVMLKVLIRDNNGVYAPKTLYLRYFYNTEPFVQDVYLINNNEL